MSDTYRKESRKDWFAASGSGAPTLEQLQFGALQRIADATELMAKRHQDLIDERDRWKRWHDIEQASGERLTRSNNALRGQITKLRKKLAYVASNLR